MAPRASWKGFLNLSLVSVPVKAYSASNSGSQIRLNQLCSTCHSRIKQKTCCPSCGDLSRAEIVKGYEYAKDQYVVIDLDELENLRAQDESKAVKIDTFVSPDQIDPLHYSDSSYYLLPDGAAGQKPYALLHQAMQRKQLHCIARVVLHNREQLVMVRPMNDLLCMTVLKYVPQIKAESAFQDELTEPVVSEAEYELAATLVDETTVQEFDLAKYHDQYTERLTNLIDAKVNGQEIVKAPAAESPGVINLMDALKASVAKAQEQRDVPLATQVRRTKKKAAKSSDAPTRKTTRKKKSSDVLAETLSAPVKKKKAKRKTKTG